MINLDSFNFTMLYRYLFLVIIISFLSGSKLCAQEVSVQFKALLDNQDLSLSDAGFDGDSKNNLQVSVLKFYCSKFQFWQDEKLIGAETNSYHLVDCSSEKSSEILIKSKLTSHFNRVTFQLGIDSATNVSGAMGGALDPGNGMYWTWQSGYINFKMEGKHPLSTSTQKEFQLHIGGYQYPFKTIQKVDLKVISEEKIIIYIDVATIINKMDWAKKSNIMSPCPEAVRLSRIIAESFRTQKSQ